jgi:hypothetical protein
MKFTNEMLHWLTHCTDAQKLEVIRDIYAKWGTIFTKAQLIDDTSGWSEETHNIVLKHMFEAMLDTA